jgi:hypothetical protein
MKVTPKPVKSGAANGPLNVPSPQPSRPLDGGRAPATTDALDERPRRFEIGPVGNPKAAPVTQGEVFQTSKSKSEGQRGEGEQSANLMAVLGERIAQSRLGRLVNSPAELALDEVERFIDESALRRPDGKPTKEEGAVRARVLKLREEIAALPPNERLGRVARETFFGTHFPESDARSDGLYERARLSWSANVVGALGALSNPLTAVLLPVVLKGGWDVGRIIQPLPHFMSDEWPTTLLKGYYSGATPTAYKSAAEYKESWRDLLEQQANGHVPLLQAYMISGLPHHVFEGTEDDLMNTNRFNDAAYVAAMGQLPVEALASSAISALVSLVSGKTPGRSPESPPAAPSNLKRTIARAVGPVLGALNPVAGLSIAGGAAMAAGLYEQFPAHRAAHRRFGEASILELLLQATGAVSSRADHAIHHKEEHNVRFSGSTNWVDRGFDEGGVSGLLNVLAFSKTQDSDNRIIPTSWARDPQLLCDLVGEDLPLDEAFRIATAKKELIEVHAVLRGAAHGGNVDELLALRIDNPTVAQDPKLQPLLDAVKNPRLAPLFSSSATLHEVYATLRRTTDGVELTAAELATVLTGPPIEEKFVRELVPQTPASAWPKLTDAQFNRAIARLREMHEPGRKKDS